MGRSVVYTDNNPLSHLTSAKLGATEQRWAAQLSAFDYTLKYRSGKSNKNADALSRQYLPSHSVVGNLSPGTLVPESLQQATGVMPISQATQAAISSLPLLTTPDLLTLQATDPVIQEVMVFWRLKKPPGPDERQQVSRSARVLLREWDRLVEKDGVLHRWILRPDAGEKVFQLVLPAVLRKDVLTQLHQDPGHQGMERTTELVRQRCYWPGMAAEVRSWCQECERCQVSKNTQAIAHSFMGHTTEVAYHPVSSGWQWTM